LKFSALEIYNKSVKDLLSIDSTPLKLLDDLEANIFIRFFKKFVLLHCITVCKLNRKAQLLRDSQRKL